MFGLVEDVFDSGPVATAPAGFKLFANRVDTAGLFQVDSLALVRAVADHQAISSVASHVFLIRSSRRATVRRAQPSCTAISSLL